MPFSFEPTSLPDVVLITPRTFKDDRGAFREVYKASEFAANGITDVFVQDNHSISSEFVLRGLHYQNPPAAQGKLVRCSEGVIWDIAVDIRKGSEHYGCWVGQELSADSCQMLYIPPGFAHGFLTLSSSAAVTYKVTAEYSPKAEAGIAWDDPTIGIQWPLDQQPLLSEKDKHYPTLAAAENGFRYPS